MKLQIAQLVGSLFRFSSKSSNTDLENGFPLQNILLPFAKDTTVVSWEALNYRKALLNWFEKKTKNTKQQNMKSII